MKTINLIQGSASWHAHRATSRNASDAPALFGVSPYVTRNELLKRRATGIQPEHDEATQARFDRGHAVEPALIAYAQAIIGEDLYPIVATSDDGYLSASFDGVSLLEETINEAKLTNATKMESVRSGLLPDVDRWQVVHQFAVCETAKRCIYCVGDGTPDGTVHLLVQRADIEPDIATLRAAWLQFDADLANYVAPEVVEKAVARPVETLPAVSIRMEGQLAVRTNLPAFGTALRDFIGRMVEKPATDQEFADAEAECKALKRAEEALDAGETNALAELADVDAFRRMKADLHALARSTRLAREKLVSAEKENRKGAIVAGAIAAFRDHITALNTRLGKPYMPTVPADFGGAVKGMKSLSSMEDKVSMELARAKIAANEVADRIDANLKHLTEKASAHKFLFHDAASIVLKAADDLQALVSSRIGEHDRAEAARLEAEREKIRAEEAAKLQREADAKAAAAKAEEDARLRAEAQAANKKAAEDAAAERQAQAAITAATTPTPATLPATTRAVAVSNPAPPPAAAPVENEKPTMRLGEINERLVVVSVNAEQLAKLGFVATVDKGSRLYRPSDFPRICEAAAQHLYELVETAAA